MEASGSVPGCVCLEQRELGCCTVGEHSIDTQGLPPCRVAPGRLSFWEETEVKRQIDTLVEMGKMRPSDSKYACRVTLPVKKDGSMRFCGDYRPLNLQTRRDSFPMPLVEDIISQMGKSAWFTALDLQSGFWQVRMAPEDIKKQHWSLKPGYMNGLSCLLVSRMPLAHSLGQCHWYSRISGANF